MDRSIIYDQAQARDYDVLNAWRSNMIALSQAVMDLLGSTSTVVCGFAATPDSPADLSINLAAGDIYQMADVDTSAYGSLSSDTAQILQQGIAAGQKLTLSTAGLSSGQSRWALVQAAFSQTDETPSDDPNAGIEAYLNTTNPSGSPWSGPNNSGAAQNTRRLGAVTVSVVYGTVAATGSEVPPSPSAGYVPLYLIDLAYAQTQITQADILVAGPSVGTGVPSSYTKAPFFTGFAGLNPKLAHGQCVLAYSSATEIQLLPKNGNNIIVDGVQYQIPGAGVSIPNTGVLIDGASGSLAASTVYYVAIYNNSGTLSPAFFSAASYSHASDTNAANQGVEVITSGGVAQSGYTLVGMVLTNSSSQFQMGNGFIGVLSWFNRRLIKSQINTNGTFTTGSTTPVDIDTTLDTTFICWADEPVLLFVSGTASNDTAGNNCATGIGIDSTSTLSGTLGLVTSASANQSGSFSAMSTGLYTEGNLHTARMLGFVNGGTGSWFGGSAAGICGLLVTGNG